jgi:diadenosine tetraphosphate (Ap4A) HIT family hydrolase
MDSAQPGRVPFHVEPYVRRSQEGPCFVCSILAGHPDYSHHDVYEDADTIAFLARWPVLLGHCLVAPKRHVHWHLAPLPPGVPYHQQQLRALSAEHGVLDVSDESQAALARAIRSYL